MSCMILHHLILLSLFVPLSAFAAVSPDILVRQLRNDTAQWDYWWSDPMRHLINRPGIQATVLGHYVYLAGGASPPQNESDTDVSARPGFPDIVSIDISKSWDENETPSIKVTERSPEAIPQMSRNLWPDTKEQLFYTWQPDQYQSGAGYQNRSYKIEVFIPDGNGRGTWSHFALNTSAPIHRSSLTGRGSAVTIARGTGFAIGGLDFYQQPVASVLEFSMSDRSIQDDSDLFLNLGPTQVLESFEGGAAEFIPTFGEHVLIMLLGGTWFSIEASVRPSTADLKNLTFFDAVTKKIYWQEATGSFPETPRSDFCTVGFETADGGYDIFLYSGADDPYSSKILYPTAYVLSLPAFRWTQFPWIWEERRARHACVAVGNSQVLVIGGNHGLLHPNKTLIFDMTTMEWKYSYDAEAPAYQRAQSIQDWYKTNFPSSIEWSSKAVRQLFTGIPDDTISEDNDSEPSPVLTETPRTLSPQTIAGIAAGSAILLTLIIILSCFIYRKRQKQQNLHSQQLIKRISSELHGSYFTLRYLGHELHTGHECFELSSTPRKFPPELALYNEYFELPCHFPPVHFAPQGLVRWPWRLALAAPPSTTDEQSQEAESDSPSTPHD